MSFCRVQPYNRCRLMIPHAPFVHLVWERLFDDHFLPHLVFLQCTENQNVIFVLGSIANELP